MSGESTVSQGRAWKFGDNLSTDQILPSRFMTMVKPHELAANCLAGADAGFAKSVRSGDVVVAGINTGYSVVTCSMAALVMENRTLSMPASASTAARAKRVMATSGASCGQYGMPRLSRYIASAARAAARILTT